jgi:hypothetical protein
MTDNFSASFGKSAYIYDFVVVRQMGLVETEMYKRGENNGNYVI